MMRVLFIAGYGRSGSTLLENVLATDVGFLALGEVRHLWQRGYLQNTLCACRAPFDRCPFWRKIGQTAFGELDQEEARRMFELRRRLLRPRRAVALLLGGAKSRAQLATYGERVRAVYDAAHSLAPDAVLIDSSKDPLHGLAVVGLPGIALHVVHLVRDPRGVANSMRRPKVRPEVYWKEQRETVRSPARSTAAWAYRNALASMLRRRGASFHRIRYEDFVRHPEAIINMVRQTVGLTPMTQPLGAEGKITLRITHSVSGNADRFGRRQITLQLDDGWRTQLPRHDRLSVTALALPQLVRYGYVRS